MESNSWKTTLWEIGKDEKPIHFEQCVGDLIIQNHEGSFIPFRQIMLKDGSLIEYPMDRFLARFGPNRQKSVEDAAKQQSKGLREV